MRSIVLNLLAATLLIPAMLGWCCHYGDCTQDVQIEAGTGISVHTASALRCLCHCGQPSKGKPCQPSQCKGFCTYVTVAKTQVDNAGSLADFSFLASTPVNTGMQAVAQLNAAHTPDDGPLGTPPVRLNVLNQIWLI